MRGNDTSRIIIDDSRVMLQIVASLNDNSRSIINNQNMFKVQATDDTSFELTVSSNRYKNNKKC
jgi:hypothetical protein